MLEGSALSLFESKPQNFELAQQLLTKIVVKMAIYFSKVGYLLLEDSALSLFESKIANY